MAASDEQRPPTERRRGTAPGEHEAREKGEWAARAADGVVPAELGGSDAPEEMLPDDPELGGDALGRPATSDEPATESGIDLAAGDRADAIADGGAEGQKGAEPDLRDAASGPRQVDLDSAE